MSRLYWHTPGQIAELRGTEFAWLRQVARRPAVQAWALDGADGLDRAHTLLTLICPDERRDALSDGMRARIDAMAAQRGPVHESTLASDLALILSTDGLPLEVAGVRLHSWDLEMNTVLRNAPDPVRLAAKISSWARYHCWFEGPDRAWAASIIDQGLADGHYRHGIPVQTGSDGGTTWVPQGWDGVRDLLRADTDNPLVLSDSVETSFPNRAIASWDPGLDSDWRPEWSTEAEWEQCAESDHREYWNDEADERFAALDTDQRWMLAMEGLRAARPWGRIGPDTLAVNPFHVPVSIEDMFVIGRGDRVRQAAASVGVRIG